MDDLHLLFLHLHLNFQCDFECKSPMGLKNHILVVHEGKSQPAKPKRFSCEICGQAFPFQVVELKEWCYDDFPNPNFLLDVFSQVITEEISNYLFQLQLLQHAAS